MKKKLPAGAVIVIAVMLLMTAVAAAVTNGFGLLRQFPEQAENAAFTDRIVTIGQTWEGKYFSAEIKEAVFDGSKLRFSMSVTPKENAPQMYVKPVVKAVYGDREHKTDMVLFNGTELSGGFWVPGINPPIHEIQPDLNDMVFEVSLVDHEMMPLVTDVDVEWTFTFNVLKTDWKIDFTKFPEPDVVESGDDTITIDHDVWMEYDKQGRKMQADAYARHELLLDEYGYGLEDIITQPFEDGYRSLTITGNYDDFTCTPGKSSHRKIRQSSALLRSAPRSGNLLNLSVSFFLKSRNALLSRLLPQRMRSALLSRQSITISTMSGVLIPRPGTLS